MRIHSVVLALTASFSAVAHAADKPVIGPAPAWVKPIEIPRTPAKADDAAIHVMLFDQQIALEPRRQTVYAELALRIQTPEGLAAGNISIPWRPDTDTVTVHKLLIRRGDQIIDVLASGQTFTVIRRETNLENAILDGVLTANIQPEGLQVGDIIDLATSITSSDPVMKAHVEEIGLVRADYPTDRVHLRIQWPSAVPVRFREIGLPSALKPVTKGGTIEVELSLDAVEPAVPPKGAPPRYGIGRLVELTDFASWADLALLMAPLYDQAAVVPAQGALRTELERIRGLSTDPKVQAEAALALVQARVRYVALAMGTGGLVPADAETTWSRRYGDCKGKTALLLSLLHALGIAAEPVLVSTGFGDGLDARLPMVGLFDHVLVRATLAGRTYWLDGTRTRDTSLDRLTVPAFGWGLPLVASGAALARMMPAPLETPSHSVSIRIDARAGLTLPAPTKVETTLRGDEAIATNLWLANLAGEARDRALRAYWRSEYDFIDVQSTSASFDPKSGEQFLAMEGLARMDWSDGWYETDGTGVGYKADFTRDPGRDRNAPFAVPYPYSTKVTEAILLPAGFSRDDAGEKGNVERTVAGIEYRRTIGFVDDILTIEKTERSVVPEFPASAAAAAQVALRELADQTIFIRKPWQYRPTDGEVAAMVASTPTTAKGFIDRGRVLLDRERFGEGIADFDRAVALDPKDAAALANRGLTRAWNDDLDLAARDIAAAAAIDPRNSVMLSARGLLAMQRGAFRDAVTAFTAALDSEPGDAFALGQRAIAYRSVGNSEAALLDAAAALKRLPSWTELYLLRATIFRNEGKRDLALAEAGNLLAANPDDAYAQVSAAKIYGALKLTAEAMHAYDRALAIKPEAYVYLNRSLNRPKADVAGRRADIDAALKLDPKLGEALAAKADLQAKTGDLAGAIATYAIAIASTPTDAKLLVDRGIVYARTGKGALAEKDFAAARAKTEDANALNSMCWAKAIAGVALESALADCDAALGKAPDVPGFLDSRGLVLLRLGRFDEAIADYDRALADHPTMPSSLFGRAVAWARKGDKVKSEADAAAAQKVSPDIATRFADYGVKREVF